MTMPLSILSFHFPIPTTLSAPHLSRSRSRSRSRSSATKERMFMIFNLRCGSSKVIPGVGEDTPALSNHSNKTTDSLSAGILSKREFPQGVWKDDIIDSLMSSNKVAEAENEKRAESLIYEIKSMFRGMGDGKTSPSAYDTAWVARIPAVDGSDHPHFPQTLQWILQNQLEDGSWGGEKHFLTYDRLLATIACVITLTIWRIGDTQVHKGIGFLKTHVGTMEDEADNDRPIGFEIVFPAMLNEAKTLCLDLPYELPSIKQMIQKREAKLKRISTSVLCTAPTILLYYLEGLQEIVEWHKIIKLQSEDGSFLGSPASTAAAFMRTGNTKCLEFLNFVLMKFGNHVPCQYPLDLMERLWAVDTVERLGIDRHFQKEIKDALDYVHSHWDKKGIGWGRENAVADIDVTAVGFRILRLHGYNVSSDVLKAFRDENGEFFRFSGHTERGVRDMLNVNRCSHVAMLGETTMEEAKLCTERYLRNALENVDALDKWGLNRNIRGEIEYALKYPWHRSLARLEARSYIEHYGINDVWFGKAMYNMPYINNEKYLELAKLDFNNVQSMQQKEIPELRRWWKSSGFAELNFTRDRVAEIYFSIASTMYEPELATCRVIFTKTTVCLVILDDLYDRHASLEEIKLFNEAFERWDLVLLDRMPEHMKICFLGLYNMVNEIAQEGLKSQGHDVLGYIRYLWELVLEAYTNEAKWSEAEFVPSFHEYIATASLSVSGPTLILITLLFTGELLTHQILSQIGYPSKLTYLLGLIGRLLNDTKTYQAERGQGEVVSAIQCYMKEHPEMSEEEALEQVYSLLENAVEDFKSEYFKTKQVVPNNCMRLFLDHVRLMQLFYKEQDGFTHSHDMEIKDWVQKILFEPVV